MQLSTVFAPAIALLFASALRGACAQSPVAKVVQLLTDLEAKIGAEGQDAQVVYAKFARWCEDRSKNVGYEIRTGKAEVAEQKATIESSSAAAESWSAKIDDLAGSLTTNEADLKAAMNIRTVEQADFVAAEKDLIEAIDVLERAILILERELRKGGASMAQIQTAGSLAKAIGVMVDASMLGSQDASRLAALVQSAQQQKADAEEDEPGAPAAAVYQGRSGSVVETLEGLLDKAKDELESSRRRETNNQHNFNMLKQSLGDEIKYGKKDMEDAKKALLEAKQTKANAEGDLGVASKSLAEDEKTHANLHQDCFQGAQDFEAATKSRAEELRALSEAKKALLEATGGAGAITYGGEAQAAIAGASLLQLASFGAGAGASSSRTGGSNALRTVADLANFEAVRLVRDLARRLQSTALSQLAMRMAAAVRSSDGSGDDPFSKVKGLIKDMLERLQREAHTDASHKAYCDEELGETGTKKSEKEALIGKLTASIDRMTTRSAQLKEEVAELHKELADLVTDQAAMDELMREQRALFTKHKAELGQGLEGVRRALSILRTYYSIDDKAHTSAAGAVEGVIGLLEVVESDFTKGVAEMTVSAQTGEAEYKSMSQENAIAQATKQQDVKYKTKEFKGLDQAAAEETSDRRGSQQELDAIDEYLGKLKVMCIAKPETYEERKRRREAEIQGLKEALKILAGEAMLLQQKGTLRGVGPHTR